MEEELTVGRLQVDNTLRHGCFLTGRSRLHSQREVGSTQDTHPTENSSLTESSSLTMGSSLTEGNSLTECSSMAEDYSPMGNSYLNNDDS